MKTKKQKSDNNESGGRARVLAQGSKRTTNIGCLLLCSRNLHSGIGARKSDLYTETSVHSALRRKKYELAANSNFGFHSLHFQFLFCHRKASRLV